jgi:Zn-dependent M28 family amino/carboxypeptidase
LIRLITLSLVFATTLGAAELPLTADARRAATVITEPMLRAPIRFLASDELEGRAPGTRGDRLTQLYLATEMEALGLQPGAADGGWLQKFQLVGIDTKVPETWSFRRGDQTLTLKNWDEFIASSGVQKDSAAISNAELVFVGYGIEAPEYQWDDYKGADLRGKVLVMMNNDPDWDPDLFEGNRRLYYGRWRYKYEIAAQKGAAGAIIIHTIPSAGYRWQVVQTSWTGEQYELPAGDEPRMQIQAWTTEQGMRKILALAGQDLDKLVASARSRDFRPVPLGITTSLAVTNRTETVETANVLGLLPGSDPVLKNEVVVYTAHHDHLGIASPNDHGDVIYNGALDNASGVSQVLAIARAFRQLEVAPRRSILFLFVAAEEQGLLGSQYYARNPTFAPGRIAANINFDGANIWGRTKDIVQVGYGKSSVDRVVEALASMQGRRLKPEQFPDRGYFYRSDQFNFAKIGVPAIYIDNGVEFHGRPTGWGKERIEEWEAEHYHQASDELTDDWNFDGVIEDAQLGFFAGYLLARQDEIPMWNPGDEFEATRKAALAALQNPTDDAPSVRRVVTSKE